MDQKLLSILGGSTEHYPYALERKYPRIFSTLMLLWDSPEIEPYFVKLMVNERFDREGFPSDVAAEIVHLSLIHASQSRQVEKKPDVWSADARMFSNFGANNNSGRYDVAWPKISHETTLAIQETGVPCNKEGYFKAASTGNVTALRLFLESGVHLDMRNEDGWTILMFVVYHDFSELAKLLIQKGARVDTSEHGGNTPLHWAAFAGHSECCKILVEAGADVDARSNFGWTPLYQAVARNHLVVAAYLIAHRADVNASAKDGQTPLHKAAATGAVEVVKLLLSHDADPSRKNTLGETPLALAIKNNQDEVIALLGAL